MIEKSASIPSAIRPFRSSIRKRSATLAAAAAASLDQASPSGPRPKASERSSGSPCWQPEIPPQTAKKSLAGFNSGGAGE